jgi:membrane-bound lytic murein transglycosylase B
MKKRLLAVAAILTVSVSCSQAADKVYIDVTEPNVAAFIDEMVADHNFERDALAALLGKAEIKKTIIKKISTPAEKKLTWAEYRKIFITRERIDAGTKFWLENREMLERIQKETGVSVEMIVGIIGVETYYGRITGKDRVIDALATLAFDYPPRSKFFRNELKQFLIWGDRSSCRRVFARMRSMQPATANVISGTTGRTWPAASLTTLSSMVGAPTRT